MAYQSQGHKLMVFWNDQQVATDYIALATNHTLTLTPQLSEERTKDDGEYPASIFDYCDWEITAEAVVGALGVTQYETTYYNLLDAQMHGTICEVVFDAATPTTGAIGDGVVTEWAKAASSSVYPACTGTAYISSVDLNAGVDGSATVSVTFRAASALSV